MSRTGQTISVLIQETERKELEAGQIWKEVGKNNWPTAYWEIIRTDPNTTTASTWLCVSDVAVFKRWWKREYNEELKREIHIGDWIPAPISYATSFFTERAGVIWEYVGRVQDFIFRWLD